MTLKRFLFSLSAVCCIFFRYYSGVQILHCNINDLLGHSIFFSIICLLDAIKIMTNSSFKISKDIAELDIGMHRRTIGGLNYTGAGEDVVSGCDGGYHTRQNGRRSDIYSRGESHSSGHGYRCKDSSSGERWI
jgi:hypothetical protein